MHEPIHPLQVEALKKATPLQKLEAAAALYEMGIRLRKHGLRMTHPDWTDEVLEREARRSLAILHEGGSDKHIRDIRFILAATTVDRDFLETEIARLGVRAEWEKISG